MVQAAIIIVAVYVARERGQPMTHDPTGTAAGDGPPSASSVRAAPGAERLAALLQRQGARRPAASLVVVAWLTFPDFGSVDNLRDIALQGSFLAVIALGMTFVIITGGIDLSVGSVFALGGVLAACGSQYGFAARRCCCRSWSAAGSGCSTACWSRGTGWRRSSSRWPRCCSPAGCCSPSPTRARPPTWCPRLSLRRARAGQRLGLGYPVWIALVLFVLGGLVLRRTRSARPCSPSAAARTPPR